VKRIANKVVEDMLAKREERISQTEIKNEYMVDVGLD